MDAIQKAIETFENIKFAFKQRGWDAYVDAAEEALTALRECRDEKLVAVDALKGKKE